MSFLTVNDSHEDVEILSSPSGRSYDPAAGDVRRFDFDEAVAEAHRLASETGVRHIVSTVVIQPGDEAIVPRFLVQKR
jgi:hypothetical protein